MAQTETADDTVLWTGALPPALRGEAAAGGLVLIARETPQGLAVSGVEPLQPPAQDTAAAAPPPEPAGIAPLARATRSAWVWQPDAWQEAPRALLKTAAQAELDTLFVTVPLDAAGTAVARPQTLADFITRASAQGIAVWAVSGDPEAVRPDEESAWRTRAAAYAAYQRAAAPSARLAGVQYDVEPYLMPEYAAAPAYWNDRLLLLLDTLKAAAPDLPLDAVVPFWLLDRPAGATATVAARLPSVADVVTVMAYRTAATEVEALARPWLAWGQDYGVPVRIALEAGPLPDEEARVFRASPEGRLWLVERDGVPTLELRAHPAANPAGRAYALSHVIPVPAARVTFHGRERDLGGILADLAAPLARWPAFAGFALHGLADFEARQP